MPLPPTAITISGGCNCSAIRYRVHIPPIAERQIHPTSKHDSEDPVHLPFVCIDHCNDCRRATGALLGVVLCAPTKYIEMSLFTTKPSYTPPSNILDNDREWFPATEIFPDAVNGPENTSISFYLSSKGRNRAWCNNCGTHMMYAAFPYPGPWPDMLDIWVGTVDQADLEKDWLVPERHLWYAVGVEWVQKFATEGSGGIPRHPLADVSKTASRMTKNEV